VNLGLIGDFFDAFEVSVKMGPILEESDLLLVTPGLKTSLVGASFLIVGDNGDCIVLVLSVGDNGILALAEGDNGDFIIDDDDIFTIGDVFTFGDNRVFDVGDNGVFLTIANDSVFATGDFGVEFLKIVDGRVLSLKVVVFGTAEVDLIVEEDLTDNNDNELDSFLIITFGEVGSTLELTMDLVTVEFIDVFIVLDFIVDNFEVGVILETDFALETVGLLDNIDGDLFVGVVGNLTSVTFLVDNTTFLTVVGDFTTVNLSLDDPDLNDVGLSSLTMVLDPSDLAVEVVELTNPCDNLGTVEVIVEVLDTVDIEEIETGEDKLDFEVEIDLIACKDVVEDLVLVVT